jgi:hypothetical protein|tara:strand:- start:173 stop:421 length:249 start_codon:yes stop_codon:yes gene_type:complete
MILEAILKINPNAIVTVSGTDINTCEIEWLNGTTPVPKADIVAMLSTVETEIANETNKKASGKQKLKGLGLDDDEIKALTGA